MAVARLLLRPAAAALLLLLCAAWPLLSAAARAGVTSPRGPGTSTKDKDKEHPEETHANIDVLGRHHDWTYTSEDMKRDAMAILGGVMGFWGGIGAMGMVFLVIMCAQKYCCRKVDDDKDTKG